MDWRMDKSSWAMLVAMLATMVYFILQGAGDGVSTAGYLQAIGYGLLSVLVLVAVASIPVLVYCYIVKMIPDIDYSIRVAFVVTIIGIISEIIF